MGARRRLVAILAAVGVVIGAAPSTWAVEDVSAPVGTITVEDGSGFASSLTVTVHVPATDDVGVVSMRLGWGDTWEDLPYAPTVQITFPYAEFWGVWVTWRDAAGNTSTAGTHVLVDTTPPVIGRVGFTEDDDGADAIGRLRFTNVWDERTAVTHVRVRSAGQPLWSPSYPVPQGQNPFEIEWPMLDPAVGGSPVVGPRTIYVQARNSAGLWSTPLAQQTSVVFVDVPIDISGDQRTGHVVTFTPRLPDEAVLPSNTVCWWTLAWGNDRSLYYGDRDDTFGLIEVQGRASKGYCDPWSVTVPWVPHRQFLVSYSAGAGGASIVDETLGGSPDDPAFEPGVDSTSRHIRSSSIPIVYVLPEDYVLVVGEPATYRAYPVGGETLKSTDVWSVDYVDHPERKFGGSTFTFIPKVTGHLTVCWAGGDSRPYEITACFDPPARRRDRTAPTTTTPIVRVATSGGTPSAVPLTVAWSGSDTGWGVESYRLERSVDGGAWARVPVASVKSKAFTGAVTPGHTYRYRVRATDKAGNVGAWDYSTTHRVALTSDTSPAIEYDGAWAIVPDASAAGGAIRMAGGPGASATLTFTGRDVAIAARRSPTSGIVKVYLDGVLVATIDLRSDAQTSTPLVWRRHFSSSGVHTVRVVDAGGVGRARVALDGFVVLR